MAEFDGKLCDERHQVINRRIETTNTHLANLIDKINGKFNKIIGMFIGVLFTIIGSLIVFIIER